MHTPVVLCYKLILLYNYGTWLWINYMYCLGEHNDITCSTTLWNVPAHFPSSQFRRGAYLPQFLSWLLHSKVFLSLNQAIFACFSIASVTRYWCPRVHLQRIKLPQGSLPPDPLWSGWAQPATLSVACHCIIQVSAPNTLHIPPCTMAIPYDTSLVYR